MSTWVIRSGKARGVGAYLFPFAMTEAEPDNSGDELARLTLRASPKLEPGFRYETRDDAKVFATALVDLADVPIECRVVRVLTHEEAKLKARAKELCAFADAQRLSWGESGRTGIPGRIIDDAVRRAEELWPAKVKP